jgi:hypothetical protein
VLHYAVSRVYLLVVGVEHGRDGLSTLLVCDGALVLARIELLEVKLATGSLAAPETKIVAGASFVSRNWSISFRLQILIANSLTRHIKSNSGHNLAALPRALLLALIVLPAIDMAVELHIHNDVVTLELPRVKVEPVIWHLNLVSIDDLLLKDTVSVTKTVSPSWVVQRGHRVEEAGGETTETAVAERGVVLLGNDIFHAEAKVGETLWRCVRKVNGSVSMS